jgi:hypothetical protein
MDMLHLRHRIQPTVGRTRPTVGKTKRRNSKRREKTIRRSSKRAEGKNQFVEAKRTVKYLTICRDPKAFRSVVCSASDRVIKAICNAALNVERGEIRLSKRLKRLFRQHRKQISKLTSLRVSLKSKRKILQQQGSGFFIPALIGAAVQGLGGLLGSLLGEKKV